ncbi:MAG: hypothetical protein K0B16_12875 [Burkholderiaceae bacterium]|nr:hypothetical protein [Burkholderiaceae bacterium]
MSLGTKRSASMIALNAPIGSKSSPQKYASAGAKDSGIYRAARQGLTRVRARLYA